MRRISNMMVTDSSVRYIQSNLKRSAKLQEQISSSKTINRPSDNPGQITHVMSINATISRNDQYLRNIDDGLGYLNQADSALNSIGETLSEAKTLALQGASETVNTDDREAIAEQVDKQIDALIDLANGSLGGKYLFAGKKNAQPPFYRDPDTGYVYYRGDTQRLSREISFGSSYEVDAAGVTAFGSADMGVFGQLTDATDPANQIDDPLNPGQKITRVIGGPVEVLSNLKGNLENDDTAGIEQSLTEIDTTVNEQLVYRVAVGARTQHLEAVQTQLEDQNTRLQEMLSSIRDADITKLAVDVAESDLVYQSSLSATTKLLQTSLLDYLG